MHKCAAADKPDYLYQAGLPCDYHHRLILNIISDLSKQYLTKYACCHFSTQNLIKSPHNFSKRHLKVVWSFIDDVSILNTKHAKD
jgi:hypothetical protein